MKPMTETERQVVRQYLTRNLDALDSPGPGRYLAMGHYEEDLKEQAKKKGLELLTPGAARDLFGKDLSSVRRAAADGKVRALFNLRATATATRLIDLGSATRCWGKPQDQLLDQMRANGLVIGIGGDVYNILNPEPLLSRYEQGESE